MKLNNLSEEEKHVILQKGTEKPFSGKFEKSDLEGIYICRQCNAYLYRSKDKFDAHCGWPSFDDSIDGAVLRQTDDDGIRIEILCNRCGAHLGHVFEGEHLTEKNVRHCVNSISMDFVNKENISLSKTIYLAGGCFWCLEAVFQMISGVISIVSGYAGGDKENPTYEEVSGGNTGYAEVVKVVFNPTIISLEKILSVFFDSHNPTTLNRQGNDVGTQYRSAIFVETKEDLDVVNNFVEKIASDYKEPIVTEISILKDAGIGKFYPA